MVNSKLTTSKKSKGDTLETFITKARKVHGDKYDYSKVIYVNSQTKVCIICPTHGEFWQRPNCHLMGQGCKICGRLRVQEKERKLQEEFIKEATLIHNGEYDYSKVLYKNNKTKICIICPTHGEFWQIPKHHLHGHGCPYCSNRYGYTTQSFIEKCKEIHGDKYDYSKVIYKGCYKKICIICPIHGEFWQSPYLHLYGQGCPSCNESKLEKEVDEYLELSNIQYIKGHHFDWLGKQHLDFYLPQYNIGIECQGIQHYEPTSFSSDKSKKTINKNFKIITTRDQRKKKLCEENGIKLLYYTNYKDVEEDNEITFKDKEKLLKYINENNFTRQNKTLLE